MKYILLLSCCLIGFLYLNKESSYLQIDTSFLNSQKNDFAVKLNEENSYFIQEVFTLKGRRRAWQNYDRHNIVQFDIGDISDFKTIKQFNYSVFSDYLNEKEIEYFISRGLICRKEKDGLSFFPINSDGVTHRSIIINSDKLYYSSNMKWHESNYGIFVSDFDIYSVSRDSLGKFMVVEVPIPYESINTECDESYVFFKDSKVYFSRRCDKSDFDIYEYDTETKIETKLPYPINSNGDDIFYQENDDGYCSLSSNRKGGQGELDIYIFKKK